MKNFYLSLLIFSTGLLIFTSCNNGGNEPAVPNLVSAQKSDIIVKWNDLFLQIERYAAGFRPGPAPRALALIGLANYEACLTGMPDFKSVAVIYPGLSIPKTDESVNYYWPEVVNSANAFLMKRIFATQAQDKLAAINTLEVSQAASFKEKTDATSFDKSKEYGEAVATAIWDWSKTDTYGHDAYLDPFNAASYKWQDHYQNDGDWKPDVPGPGKPMFPLWGKARTFAISETDKLCASPIEYSAEPNSQLYAQALEVYAQSSIATQTYEGKWIGEYWSDDLLGLTFSPGPRWIAVANQVYVLEESNLETAIYANVKVGMALNDAAVACWHSKYAYNVERPESYIKRVIDPNYEPALNNPINNDTGFTPPFPAYPSGHSTMGSAAAEALSDIFGYNYAMTDRCHEGRTEFVGTPRSFNSFYEMAEENAISRVPLGVHFRMDCEQGVNLGLRCGRKVNNLGWKK
jgi:PAP2 superfamily